MTAQEGQLAVVLAADQGADAVDAVVSVTGYAGTVTTRPPRTCWN